MPKADLPKHEIERLQTLHSLNLLDTPPDPAFDRITRLAARALDVPIALVGLIDENRQWYKSSIGVDAKETSRDLSFCSHAILNEGPTIVSDAKLDSRFSDNRYVTGDSPIRFYAGIPIHSSSGHVLGTFCVVDIKPRALTEDELTVLHDFAEMVTKEIQHHEAFVLHLHHMADAIEESDARFRIMFERAAVGMALVSATGNCIRANDALCKIINYSHDELYNLNFQELTHSEDRERESHLLEHLVAGEIESYQLEKRYVCKNGKKIWVHLSVTKQLAMDGVLDYFVLIIKDVQARKEAEASLSALRRDLENRVEARTNELRKSNEMLSYSMAQQVRFEQSLLRRESELTAILENANDAYVCMDSAGVVSAWNRLARETFGWTAEEAIGRRIDELIIPEAMREMHREGMRRYKETGESTVLNKRIELPAVRKDGTTFPVEIRIRAIDIDGQKIFSAFLHDITDRKQVEGIREYEALHDSLTGLPNRRSLNNLLPKALARANRNGKPMAVLFLDLDNFKRVNDTQGHEAGDSLLKEIARRLVDCIRQTDTAIRLSGDEFTVVLENLVNGLEDAKTVAEKLLTSISSPVQIGTEVANVGVSIGIAMHDGKQDITADTLLKMADTVMYKAKNAGKSTIKWD